MAESEIVENVTERYVPSIFVTPEGRRKTCEDENNTEDGKSRI